MGNKYVFKYLWNCIAETLFSDICRGNTKYEIVWQKCQETIENLFHKRSHSKNSQLTDVFQKGKLSYYHFIHALAMKWPKLDMSYLYCLIMFVKYFKPDPAKNIECDGKTKLFVWIWIPSVLMLFLSIHSFTPRNGHCLPLVAISILSVKSVGWRKANGEYIFVKPCKEKYIQEAKD